MLSEQQNQTREYFSKVSASWHQKASCPDTGEVDTIGQRNNFVLQVAQEREQTCRFLDVGCGSGELVCAMASHGVASEGVDFSQEMISIAKQKSRNQELSAAQFHCFSIFDFPLAAKSFDLISANGFIEYISHAELARFFDLVQGALRPGGSFVVGSRNRLFNLFSMNQFTEEEMKANSFSPLLQEALWWAKGDELSQAKVVDCVLMESPDRKHQNTGIEVATRHQYTPLQLMKELRNRELHAEEVYPVHLHGISPVVGRAHPLLHVSLSNAMQTVARHNRQLLWQASSFMLHVKKGDPS